MTKYSKKGSTQELFFLSRVQMTEFKHFYSLQKIFEQE